MEDRHVVAAAVAAWLGAWSSADLPRWVAASWAVALLGLVGLLALHHRRLLLFALTCGALAASLGTRSWAGLDPPIHPRGWAGSATLVTDPVRVGAGWKVELRLDGGRRVEAFAYGRAASVVRARLAGERIHGRGRLAAPPRQARGRLALRHVAARLSLASARPAAGALPWSAAANAVRRTLDRGASSLDVRQRALWSGLVYGDDREEDPGVASDFSLAGLSHLLSVSGQNVAFALAAAGPVLRRFRLRGRLLAGVGVLGLFGVAVRFEPSVLRAAAMAALALTAGALGVETSSVRLLGLAVTALVLVDPLLVHRLGFQLSVAATAGIALWSRRLAVWLPGPATLREAAATALAAQTAVAPLLLAVGGTSPVALPANVLAVPAAGPVMVWGLTGGLAAGLLGGGWGVVLHLPDRALLGWLAGVARVAASAPFAPVAPPALALTAALVVGAIGWARLRGHLLGLAGLVLVVPSLVGGTVGGPRPGPAAGAPEVVVWHRASSTLVSVAAGDPGRVLTGLRRSRVTQIDLLLVDGTGPGVLAVVDAVLDRHAVRQVAGRASVDIDGLVVLDERHRLRSGPFLVEVDRSGHPVVTADP